MLVETATGYPAFMVIKRVELRVHRILAWVGSLCLLLLVSSALAMGVEVPLSLTADEVFISSESDYVEATGSVEAELDNLTLSADRLIFERTENASWSIEASGSVRFDSGDALTLTGDRLSAAIQVSGGKILATSLEAAGFGGRSRFVNSDGDENTIFFVAVNSSVSSL